MNIKVILEAEVAEPTDRLISELKGMEKAPISMLEMVLTQQGKIRPTDIRVTEIQLDGKSASGKHE